MDTLSEREKKLLDYIKVLINLTTIHGIYIDKIIQLTNWRSDAMKSAGAGLEWQNEMLKFLESEYGLKYTKLDSETKEVIEEDGEQS